MSRIFSFEGDGRVRQFEGGYSDYLIRKELERLPDEEGMPEGKEKRSGGEQKAPKKTWKQQEQKLKFSFKEQREFETIDEDIAALEQRIEKLDADIMANATNSVKLSELTAGKEEAKMQLEEKMDRWVYLNDLAEKIEAQKKL